MKKLDKLVLGSFTGPFVLTFLVVVFILLTQHMLKYFDDIIGKDLGWDVLGQLLFYFAIFMTPVALPLAVLLSSLITFGNLGEHFELTAIKSGGISMLRTLRPIFFFVLLLTVVAFFANNNLVPKAALEAYSLLYDIKQKKPALDLKEGAFYNGLPDISIKVNKKFPDGKSIKEIVVYDHRQNDGNRKVTVADSGRMYTILNERYLKFELYFGYNYTEGGAGQRGFVGGSESSSKETMTRMKFDKSEVVFDLSSFVLPQTEKDLFKGNRIMRNLSELETDIDSIRREVLDAELNTYIYKRTFFNFYFKKDSTALPARLEAHKTWKEKERNIQTPIIDQPLEAVQNKSDVVQRASDSLLTAPQPAVIATRKKRMKSLALRQRVAQESTLQPAADATVVTDSALLAKIDSLFNAPITRNVAVAATNMARQVKSHFANAKTTQKSIDAELAVYRVQWHKILASSMACIAMFLIGAPLGAIIKKGGLGVPFLVSILFFIIYYVLNMQGEKLAKQGAISPAAGVWFSDVILFVVGMLFLRQARNDARLFEGDFYRIWWDNVRKKLSGKAKMAKTIA